MKETGIFLMQIGVGLIFLFIFLLVIGVIACAIAMKDIESKEGLHMEVLVEVIRQIKTGVEMGQALVNGMVEWDL